MGCVSSKSSGHLVDDSLRVSLHHDSDISSQESEDTHWRLEPQKALNKFLDGGDVLDHDFDYFSDDDFVELRTLLDEPLGRSHFLAHISQYKPEDANLVKMWLLLHSYHHMDDSPDKRYLSCRSLYKNYFHITRKQKSKAEMFRETRCMQPDSMPQLLGNEAEKRAEETEGSASEDLDPDSFSQYLLMLVPKNCSNFNQRLIATIIQLRPSVEMELLRGHPRFQNSQRMAASSTTRLASASIDSFVDIGPTDFGQIVNLRNKDNEEFGKHDVSGSKNKNITTEDCLVSEGNRVDSHNISANSIDHQIARSSEISEPGTSLFLDLQNEVFKEMKPLYQHFKETSDDYDTYKKCKKMLYNRVLATDFIYLKQLGKGAFGQVVHVIKKSTGMHYAMKIQRKDTLVSTWNPDKMIHVEIERDVLVAHRTFPFIVSLRYAFQNEDYAFLCLDLAQQGSLRSYLDTLPGFQMQVGQLRLYVAELILALECLHDHDIIYRDLKPENVLLFNGGHVKLADMGLAGFYYEDKDCAYPNAGMKSLIGFSCTKKLAIPKNAEMEDEDADLFDTSSNGTDSKTNEDEKIDGKSDSTSNSESGLHEDCPSDRIIPISPVKKSRTIQTYSTDCGTTLYRPPEMIRHEHYNEGVDWFMLGVFTYECLCGKLPFLPHVGANGEVPIDTEEQELRIFSNKLRIPNHLGEHAIDLISGLLDMDPAQRLGVGEAKNKRDLASLKEHKFFVPLGGALNSSCNWDKVLNMQYKPAYTPDETELNKTPQFGNFHALVRCLNKQLKKEAKHAAKHHDGKNALKILLPWEHDHVDTSQFFQNWDYIDPSSIMLEKQSEKCTMRTSRRPFPKTFGSLRNQFH